MTFASRHTERQSWRAQVLFLLRHALIGFGLAAVFVGAVLWSNAFGLGHLLLGAVGHPLPLLLLWFFTGLTMGSIQMGIAVMSLGDENMDSD
jgi:tetrahydromethanopterin S-methyltransferase subunit E